MLCSQEGHNAKSKDCPAKNDMCRYCHRPGHWEWCCFMKEKSRVIASEGMSKRQLGHNQVNHLMVSLVASNSFVGSGANESLMLTQLCNFYPNNYITMPVPMDSAPSVSGHSSVHGDGQEIDQSKQKQGKWLARAGRDRTCRFWMIPMETLIGQIGASPEGKASPLKQHHLLRRGKCGVHACTPSPYHTLLLIVCACILTNIC